MHAVTWVRLPDYMNSGYTNFWFNTYAYDTRVPADGGVINISLLYDQSAMKYMYRINIINAYVMEDFNIYEMKFR